jgi:dynein heavy chain
LVTAINWDVLYSAEIRCQGQFEKIQEHVVKNWATWQKWATEVDPYSAVIPGGYGEKISNFDKLLLIKVFRPEMIQISMTTYIINEMEKFYVEPPATGMNILFENIDQQTPLIFILSQGADPTSQLLKFASEMDFKDKLYPISLGQG